MCFYFAGCEEFRTVGVGWGGTSVVLKILNTETDVHHACCYLSGVEGGVRLWHC